MEFRGERKGREEREREGKGRKGKGKEGKGRGGRGREGEGIYTCSSSLPLCRRCLDQILPSWWGVRRVRRRQPR